MGMSKYLNRKTIVGSVIGVSLLVGGIYTMPQGKVKKSEIDQPREEVLEPIKDAETTEASEASPMPRNNEVVKQQILSTRRSYTAPTNTESTVTKSSEGESPKTVETETPVNHDAPAPPPTDSVVLRRR